MSIGEVLTAARREAGLSVTHVSQRTRIRETIVRGIEQDDFSGCGGDFYARGHIRAIARVSGVDPEPLVREYDASQEPPPEAGDADEPQAPAPVRLRERRRPSWAIALLAVLVVLAGLVIYHLVSSHSAGDAGADRKLVTAHKTAAPARTPPPPARQAARQVVISLTAVNEACWADLITSSGATIFQGILNPGTSKTWTSRQAVTLHLGNPGAVTLTVDGKSRTGLGSDPVTLSLRPGQSTSAG